MIERTFACSKTLIAGLLASSLTMVAAAAVAQQPNIVVIIADDAGYVDYGFQGSSVIPTPRLDQLAAEGVRFTNAYIQSVCSPSRAILATGQYGGRFGYEQNIPNSSGTIGTTRTVGLSPDQTTIFDRMRELGYSNFVVGKWHLGLHADNVQNGVLIDAGNRPTQQGIDEFFGLLGGSRPYFVGDQSSVSNRLIVETRNTNGIVQEAIVESDFSGQYLTDVIGEKTADYISSQSYEGPFLIYSSFTAPHTPLQAKAEDLAAIDALNNGLSGNRRTYAAMQLAMDRAVGSILDRIEDPNEDGDTGDSIADNTLVIFVNDNGGDCCDSNTNASFNGVLKNGKGSIWEGGIRTPMLFAGAGIDPTKAGTDFTAPVHAGDIVATCFAAGGGSTQFDFFDGVDLRPFTNGDIHGEPHEIVYIRRPSNLGLACRSGNFKLYHDRNIGFALFDLSSNPGENLSNNLLNQMPALADSLKQKVTEFDVDFVKRRWNVDNLDSNEFRFREGAFTSANWDALNAWTNLSDDNGDGENRLGPDDGNSSTTLVFRAKNGGDYVATNNLTRANGLEFMANKLQFVTRPEGLNGSRNGTIDGLPVVLAESPDGVAPKIELDSFDPSPNFMTFDWQIDLLLYDDLTIEGNGNDDYTFSGMINEYRPGRNLTKTGTSSVHIAATSTISGTIAIEAGAIHAGQAAALGTADIAIGAAGTLVLDEPLLLAASRCLAGEGTIVGNIVNEGTIQVGQGMPLAMLQLDGDFTQGDTGVLQIDIAGPNTGEFDRLVVSQDLILGGSLQVEITDGQDSDIQIIAAGGTVQGSFDNIAINGPGNWKIDYRNDGVWITGSAKSTLVDSIAVSIGEALSGNELDLSESDDQQFRVEANAGSTQWFIELIAIGTMPGDQLQTINMEIEAAANSPNLKLLVEALDNHSGEFSFLGKADLANSDQTFSFDFGANPSRFVTAQSNQVIVRLRVVPGGPVLFFPWNLQLDRLVWFSTQ